MLWNADMADGYCAEDLKDGLEDRESAMLCFNYFLSISQGSVTIFYARFVF